MPNCIQPYFKDNIQNLTYCRLCSAGYVLDMDNITCIYINPLYNVFQCQGFFRYSNSTVGCSKCNDGYMPTPVNSIGCIPVIPNCLVHDLNTASSASFYKTICTLCNPGYVADFDKSKCLLIPNCIEYAMSLIDYSVKCTSCESLSTPSADGK